MLRAYKYRILPNNSQKELIEKHFGCCRLVYNLALETRQEAYKKGVKLSTFDLHYQLTDLKKDFKWLKEIDSQALLAAIEKVDIAYINFFKGTGYPKFKSKHSKQSYQCPNNTRRINWDKGTLDLPKMKGIPIVLSQFFKCKIKSVTVSKTATNKYFASILVDTNIKKIEKKPIKPKTTIGIDLGIKDFAILSNGERIVNPKYLQNNLTRLKILQRRLSRKYKGGKNWHKARLTVAKKYEKIKYMRDDNLHKLSHKLTHDNQVSTICVESLAVKNMLKNHKLAQAISDVSWGHFIELLRYKCEWYGVNLIEIGRFEPSTKKCSVCGNINETLTLADREWLCVNCGTLHDRDINAAINIKKAGLKQTGHQGSPEVPVELPTEVGAMKQEWQINYQ